MNHANGKIIRCQHINPKTGVVCGRFLLEAEDVTGTIRIKCPRCHNLSVIHMQDAHDTQAEICVV